MNLQPGRELDAKIAEKLFGWTDFSPIDPMVDYGVGVNGYRRNYARDTEGRHTWFPFYSTSWNGMQLVVEEMRRRNWQLVLNDDLDKWTAIYFWDPNGASYEAEAESAPHAVCMAALSALEGQADA